MKSEGEPASKSSPTPNVQPRFAGKLSAAHERVTRGLAGPLLSYLGRMQFDHNQLPEEVVRKERLDACRANVRKLIEAQCKRLKIQVEEPLIEASIECALKAALDFQLADERRNQQLQAFDQSKQAQKTLVKQLESFRDAVGKLDRSSKRELNRVVKANLKHGFDTDALSSLLRSFSNLRAMSGSW